MAKYIYQFPDWPNCTWDEKKIQLVDERRSLVKFVAGAKNTLVLSLKLLENLKPVQ